MYDRVAAGGTKEDMRMVKRYSGRNVKTRKAVEGSESLHFPSEPTKVLSIISNKGGVGKSHFAINISYALSKMGKKVLLVDSDLSSGTTGIKFGLFPEFVLKDFFSGDKEFADLIVPTRYPFFYFIGGSAGDFDLANMNYAKKKKFIRSYMDLARKGMYDTMDFALSSHQVIIIITPQDVISGYGCLKGSFIRFIQLASKGRGIKPEHKVFYPLIVVNQARSRNQGSVVFNVISNLVRESTQEILLNLGQPAGVFQIEPHYLGEIPYVRDTLIRAEMARKPVMEMFPRSGATSAFRSLAKSLAKELDEMDTARLKSDFLEQWIGGDEDGSEIKEDAGKKDRSN